MLLLFLVSLFKILPFKLPLRLHQKCVPLNLKVTRYIWTLRPTIRTIIFSVIMKIQILLLRLAPGMSVDDTKCDKKYDIGIINLQ